MGYLERSDSPFAVKPALPASLAGGLAGCELQPVSWQDAASVLRAGRSDVLIFIGCDPARTPPEMRAALDHGKQRARVIVLGSDARTEFHDGFEYLAVQAGSMPVLLYGIANILIASGWVDRDFIETHTTGFDAFSNAVAAYTTDRVCTETGLDAEDVWIIAEAVAHGQSVSLWWDTAAAQAAGDSFAEGAMNLARMTPGRVHLHPGFDGRMPAAQAQQPKAG